MHDDSLLVAAECGCGRVFAMVDGMLLAHGDWGSQHRPLIMSTLRHDPTIGTHVKDRIRAMRDRIGELERMIGAATWASARPMPEVKS